MNTYYFELLIHQVFIFNIDQMNQWGLYQNVRLTISEKQFLNISMHWCILFLSLAFHLLMFWFGQMTIQSYTTLIEKKSISARFYNHPILFLY